MFLLIHPPNVRRATRVMHRILKDRRSWRKSNLRLSGRKVATITCSPGNVRGKQKANSVAVTSPYLSSTAL